MVWRVFAATFVISGLLVINVAWAASDVPLPSKTQTAQVAKRIIYNGLDMQASVFQSRLSQKQVVDYYKQLWGKQVSVTSFQSSQIVGHLDGDHFITVQVTPDGNGSKGSIGVVKLPSANASRPKLGQGLPQPFGAKVLNDISYPDDRTPARTVLLLDKLAPAQNASYFRSRLIANGWKDANINHCGHDADHCVMQFDRDKSHMMFIAERSKGRSQVLINILNPDGG